MKKKLLFALLLATGILKTQAQIPVFNTVTPNASTVQKLEKFELTIDLTAAYTNPYDYSDIDVQCVFTSPSNSKDTTDGFYEQDYTLNTTNGSITSAGTAHFKVRYAPKEVGSYSYVLMCTNKSGKTVQPAQTFASTASASPGYIRKNATNYLAFDNNAQYIPVGENMCWQDNNVYNNYTTWLPKLASNGGNYIRVWMSSWAFAYEWKDLYNQGLYKGLENYNQYNAFNLDWLLDYCSQQNVYVMLCLNNHGQVSTTVNPEWAGNPYNAINGGPCTNTWDFFSNTTAKEYYKNRMRYLVARCGYSKNIMSWELFNEVGFTDDYASHQTDVSNWHNEMSAYLKTIDVNKHLVTTSFGDQSYNPAAWTSPNIDFTQIHNYSSVPNLESLLVSGANQYLTAYQKPVLNGEFGLGPEGSTLSVDDPAGVHIHNAIWATSLSGALGSAMTWWWNDYVEPQNLYRYFQPLSSFLNQLHLKDDNYKPASGLTSGGGATNLTVSPGANWGKAPANNFSIDATGKLTPDASQLSQYIYGSSYNTQYRNPPTFTVTYPIAGQFIVYVGAIGTSPKVTITVDGKQVLNADAVANTAYSVNIAAGSHTILVDNLGTDWFNVSSYVFTNLGSPLSSYLIQSADSNKAAGWILNTQYNWQYLKSNGNVPPAPVASAKLMINGMKTGHTYTVQFYDCSTGLIISTASTAVSENTLSVPLPAIAWDMAFTITDNAVLPVTVASFTGQTINVKNILSINIAQAVNVKSVVLERCEDGITYSLLSTLSNGWNTLIGKHSYTDASPFVGSNYYRLSVQDVDGKISYSNTVVLNSSGSKRFTVYPNPAQHFVRFFVEGGTYTAKLSDASGKIVIARRVISGSYTEPQTFWISQLPAGLYYLTLLDESGKRVDMRKIMKK